MLEIFLVGLSLWGMIQVLEGASGLFLFFFPLTLALIIHRARKGYYDSGLK